MAARSIGSGTISFGLVSIPFKLFTATSAQAVSFNLLHKGCGSRLKQQLFCPVDNVVVERSDTVRGFEYARDQYVTFTDEELKAMESERTGRLEIQEFVPASSVDYLYIEKTYYIGPDKGADRAYALLSQALERNERLAVGRFAQRGKDNLVLVRSYKNGLILHECYYADEVRSFDDVDTGGTFEFKPIEHDLADKLIQQLDKDEFEPGSFRDEWADRVKQAVEKKIAGEEISIVKEQPKAQIIDLLEALKRSVAQAESRAESSRSHAESSSRAAPNRAESAQPRVVKGPKKAAPREEEPKAVRKKKSS